jgi:hypothetical protein
VKAGDIIDFVAEVVGELGLDVLVLDQVADVVLQFAEAISSTESTFWKCRG